MRQISKGSMGVPLQPLPKDEDASPSQEPKAPTAAIVV